MDRFSGSPALMRGERQYVVDAIRAFLDGSGGAGDWEEFLACPVRARRLDDIRRRARAVAVPLDAEGEALLRALLDEAESLTPDGRAKREAWRMEIGMLIGLGVGALLWWRSYLPGGGYFQNLQLLLIPAAAGILIVAVRNKRQRLGYYDPDTMAQNRRGRV